MDHLPTAKEKENQTYGRLLLLRKHQDIDKGTREIAQNG